LENNTGARTRQETSIVQEQKQPIQDTTAEDTAWLIDGSAGFFFF
jgi:hypothetical protein